MGPKVFIGWFVAAALTLVAAIAVVAGRPAVSTVELSNDPAFPVLRAQPDAVTRIAIGVGAMTFNFVRGMGGRWSAAGKHDYPVSAAEIRKLVSALTDMRLVEAKTAREDRYARLAVEDVGARDSKSRLVRLEDSAGKVVAEAIIGKRSSRFTAGRDAGTYLRRAGEQQAWLASGGVTVHDELADWLVKEIVDLLGDTVRRVEIIPIDGVPYAAARKTKDDRFTLENVPAGRAAKADSLGRLGSGLARVELKDVRPAAQIEVPSETHVARLTTFDGLEVTAEIFKHGGGDWALFSARPAGEEAGDVALARSDQINARVGGWAYKLEAYVADRLTTPREEFLEKKDAGS